MSKTFITDLHIEKVRHIENFAIPLSKSEMKHLIITGKNGSGKTSVLDYINTSLTTCFNRILRAERLNVSKQQFAIDTPISRERIDDQWAKLFKKLANDTGIYFTVDANSNKNKFIHAVFAAKRFMPTKTPKGVKQLSDRSYDAHVDASADFMQYLANSVFNQLLAEKNNDYKSAQGIAIWIDQVKALILSFVESNGAKITFDNDSYTFRITEPDKSPYNISQLPDGFAAVMNIISGIMLRIGLKSINANQCEGVILIDEVDAHLHVSLQKKILPFLTAFFPNIQFIVTTHSPFVISSIKNAVICDLEKRIVTEDLSGYSYGTLVESYFGNDNYSDQLKSDLTEYEKLMKAEQLSLDEEERLQDLELKLNQLPKYWAPELDFKLKQIQLEKADRATA